ncbi:MAG TPA: substrate-binding domain-containing protein, partial [Bradyrhizobium sp.]|nr:substrate-binding domain-containing protein [Bradyrhizobium sp.]
KVFTSVALTNALDELAPIFEQKTGNKLTIGRAIERLGIAEQMKSKTTLVPGAQSPDLVAKGEVELGIAQASEIVPNAGAQLVGPLPGELGSMTQFSGGIGAESASANASKALIDFLAGQEAGSHFKAKGFEPGG